MVVKMLGTNSNPLFYAVVFICCFIFCGVCALSCSLSHVQLLANPWTVAHQAPLSIGFSRLDSGVGCHSLLQGIFLTQGSNPGLLHCRQILYHLSHQGIPNQLYSKIRVLKNVMLKSFLFVQ